MITLSSLRNVLVVAALTTGSPALLGAEDSKPKAAETVTDAEKAAWKAVKDASRPPLPPSEWNEKKPSAEEYAAFRRRMGESAAQAADKAKAFVETYPKSPRVAEANDLRLGLLQTAVQLGISDRAEELQQVAGPAVKVEPTTQKPSGAQSGDAFMTAMQAAAEKAMALQGQGMEAVLVEFEKGVRKVMKEFPDRPEAYAALLQVAEGLGGDKAKAIGDEIAQSNAPAEIKAMATAQLKQASLVGQPVDIAFTALDGRKVDLAAMKGKVVLVDFWATWCGPCVAELPNVKAAYDKLHAQGFEIVGISFDEDRDALESFVKKKSMAWPQYFDGQGWKNKFGKEFGIRGIPAMWLVDRQGKVRDLNARGDLAAKVEKLLAEKP